MSSLLNKPKAQTLIEGPREAGASDAPFHEALLANRTADELLARAAVLRAIARGLPRETAERLYMGRE